MSRVKSLKNSAIKLAAAIIFKCMRKISYGSSCETFRSRNVVRFSIRKCHNRTRRVPPKSRDIFIRKTCAANIAGAVCICVRVCIRRDFRDDFSTDFSAAMAKMYATPMFRRVASRRCRCRLCFLPQQTWHYCHRCNMPMYCRFFEFLLELA